MPVITGRYSENADVTLYAGDRLELLKKIPSGRARLVVTSPPYNIGKKYEKRLLFERHLEQQEATLSECFRIVAEGWEPLLFSERGDLKALHPSPRCSRCRRGRVDCSFKQFYVILCQISVSSEPLLVLLRISQAPEILGPDGDPTPDFHYSEKLQLQFCIHVFTPSGDACATRRHSRIRESYKVPRGHFS